MPHLIRHSILLAMLAASLVLTLGVSPPALAQIDPAASYYVPEAGPVAVPVVGPAAVAFFRGCPNNDVGSWPSSARIRVHLEDIVTGLPMVGVPAGDIYCKFNGGPVACVPPPPGLPGADEIIANGIVNFAEGCPTVQFLEADGPTDAAGNAYITFNGADPAAPGVAARDPLRKWGHYDDIPVYVIDPVTGAETAMIGRITTAAAAGSYGLQLKNFDITLGVNCLANQGEVVSASDFNAFVASIGQIPAPGTVFYWRDFNSSGAITVADFNMFAIHVGHDCNTPLAP